MWDSGDRGLLLRAIEAGILSQGCVTSKLVRDSWTGSVFCVFFLVTFVYYFPKHTNRREKHPSKMVEWNKQNPYPTRRASPRVRIPTWVVQGYSWGNYTGPSSHEAHSLWATLNVECSRGLDESRITHIHCHGVTQSTSTALKPLYALCLCTLPQCPPT